MGLAKLNNQDYINPLDYFEQLAAVNDWQFDSSTDEEIYIFINGIWSQYNISINLNKNLDALQIACEIDLRVPPNRHDEVHKLISQINIQLIFGHFDFWPKQNILIYRYGHILSDRNDLSYEQSRKIIKNLINVCENHYPAFQYVTWAGKSADQALSTTLFETAGEA